MHGAYALFRSSGVHFFKQLLFSHVLAPARPIQGRDKLARIFQYSARLLVGSVALLQPTAGEPRSPEVCHTGVLETATTVPTGGSKLEIRLRSLG